MGCKTGMHEVVRQFLGVIDFFVVGRSWEILIRPFGLNGLPRIDVYTEDFGN